MEEICYFTLDKDQLLYICVCPHSAQMCARCRSTFSLPKGHYTAKINDNSLDIVQQRNEFDPPQFISTNVEGAEYDWTVTSQTHTIVAETTPIETANGLTVILGEFVVHRGFRSFSLTDETHSDEGWYNFVINKYKTLDGLIGVCFSGEQNECDYADDERRHRGVVDRNGVEFVELCDDLQPVYSDDESSDYEQSESDSGYCSE